MLRRDLPSPTGLLRLRQLAMLRGGDAVRWAERWARDLASVGPASRPARGFAAFGDHSVICWPWDSLVNPQGIRIGSGTIVAPHVVLSTGWEPDQPGLRDDVLVIGDRCLIGRGSSIVAHESIRIDDDVWTGHHVHITDMNHGHADPDAPISQQFEDPAPVHIGEGSWLGHGVVVLPGVSIGRHVVVGAGSVVTHDLPDHSVCVGSPARPVR